MSYYSIAACRVENLRNYSDTKIEFNDFTVLVGENNEGKSSILKMIASLFNELDKALLSGERRLSMDEESLWMPANNSHHRARRLTLHVKINNKRIARKYSADSEGVVFLRLTFLKSERKVRLNLGQPKRGESGDSKAITLWSELKSKMNFILIPAVREANNSEFQRRLEGQVDSALYDKLHRVGRGGSTRDYRDIKEVIDNIGKVVRRNQAKINVPTNLSVINNMIEKSEVRFEADADAILEFIKDNLHLSLSTGIHDELKVRAGQVGNGLQSILDISLSIDNDNQTALFLIVEEPEVFLHPSAQRELITGLRESLEAPNKKVVITTHSPVIIDESSYDETVLVRKQRFYCPKVHESRRTEINSSLLTLNNAEMFFSKVVLLVEGPSDKAFFDIIFRRMRKTKKAKDLSMIVTLGVGGKAAFAPKILLLKSFGRENDRPIKWYNLFDADAAVKDGERALLRCLRDSGSKIPQDTEATIVDFGDSCDSSDREAKFITLNNKLNMHHSCLFSVDLEWAMLKNISDATLTTIFNFCDLGTTVSDKRALATKLGSKLNNTSINEPIKAPYIRAKIAEIIPFNEISDEVVYVIKNLLRLLYCDDNVVDEVIKSAINENPQI